MVRLAICLALALVACKDEEKKPPPPPPPVVVQPPPPDPGPPDRPPSVTKERLALAEKVLAHMEAIATAGEANKTDCTAAAAAMKKAMDIARPDLEAMAVHRDEATDKAADAWFEKHYGQRMIAVMQKAIVVSKSCKDNAEFTRAMAESPF
jgi:hypothetical protein